MIRWVSARLRRRRWLLTVPPTVRWSETPVVGDRVRLWAPQSLRLGRDVHLGSDVRIEVDGEIGDHVFVANGAAIVGRRDHDMRVVGVPVTRSPWVGSTPGLSLPTVVGSDVWIGYGALVLSGVTVGDSAVVAAGAVVTRDVPPNSIVAGNPAREVGRRFDAESLTRHWDLLRDAGVSLKASTTKDFDDA